MVGFSGVWLEAGLLGGTLASIASPFLRVVCVVGGLWWVRCWVLRGRPLVCGWFLVGMLVLWALFVWVCGVGVCGF